MLRLQQDEDVEKVRDVALMIFEAYDADGNNGLHCCCLCATMGNGAGGGGARACCVELRKT